MSALNMFKSCGYVNNLSGVSQTAQYSTTASAKNGVGIEHRSLDFSNVSLNENNATSNLRKYHQTRLYIEEFCNMYQNGKRQGCNKTYLISGNLPENISYGIGSSWQEPFSVFGDATFNVFMQTVGSKLANAYGKEMGSGINRISTIKIWNGTKPLSLTLKIPVIDDSVAPSTSGVKTSLIEALEYLGSLCLPADRGTLGFYTPPPSPLSFTLKYGSGEDENVTFQTTKARIALQLGGVLFVDHCIVEGIDVDYPNTKTLTIKDYYGTNSINTNAGQYYLTPLLATVTIKLTTIEALTANTYSKMLWMHDQRDQGVGNSDISAAGDWLKDQYKNYFGKANDDTYIKSNSKDVKETK